MGVTEGWHIKNSSTLRDTYGAQFVLRGLIHMVLVLYIVVSVLHLAVIQIFMKWNISC